MKIYIDERERALINSLEKQSKITIVKQVLHLGDVLIQTNEGQEVVLMERKTISDLLASIKDGRYKEQSYRLFHSSGMSTHRIIYIIEGAIPHHNAVEKQLVYSSIVSLNQIKGFSVYRTANVEETAEMIVNMADKLQREMEKGVFILAKGTSGLAKGTSGLTKDVATLSPEIEEITEKVEETEEKEEKSSLEESENIILSKNTIDIPENYCHVVKKVKKENITPENMGEIILSQIPGMSTISAIAIMKEFSSFSDFFNKIQKEPECLDNIYIENNGKKRKLAKNIIENIKKFLL